MKLGSTKKPIAFDPNQEKLVSFKKRFPVDTVIDHHTSQLEELFLIRNPRYRFDKNYQSEFERFTEEYCGGRKLEATGNWFYFPWNRLLVHYLPDGMHQELRTARNRNLITIDEQRKFYNFNVGITGLSVGSHAALTLAMMGAARIVKLADPDKISGSNLNRIRYDFTSVGAGKCDLVSEQIYQINPYAEIYAYTEGITTENIVEFLAGPPKLDVLVEELDNPEMKIALRLEARKLGIPVLMATDNGHNVIMDVERYDLDRNLQIFNGAVGDLTMESFKKLSPKELPMLITQVVGKDLVTVRALGSLLEVGKSLYSWPQLGDAATLSGVAIAHAVKRLALGESLRSGKFEVNMDSIFDPSYRDPKVSSAREAQRREFLKAIGLDS